MSRTFDVTYDTQRKAPSERERAMFTKALGDTDLPEFTLHFIASTSSMDRERDTIAQDGWDLSNLMKNPVFLWVHDYEFLPIGRITDAQIIEGQFRIEVLFDKDDPFAVQVYNKYVNGFLHAVSVGFNPTKWMWNEDGGIDFIEQEALEVSAVPVPCNAEALLLRAGDVSFAKSTDDDAISYLKSRGYQVTRGHQAHAFPEEVIQGIALAVVELLGKGAPEPAQAVDKAMPDEVEVGDYVSFSGPGEATQGVIERISTTDVLVEGSSEAEGSEEDPAAIVRLYEWTGEAWKDTEERVAVLVSDMTKIDPLEPAGEPEEDEMKIHLETEGAIIEPSIETKALILGLLQKEAELLGLEDMPPEEEADAVVEEVRVAPELDIEEALALLAQAAQGAKEEAPAGV